MSLSNYPPGVTGREWQIAGPSREVEETKRCDQCSARKGFQAWQAPDGTWYGLDDDGEPSPLNTFEWSDAETVETAHYRAYDGEWWSETCDDCGYTTEGWDEYEPDDPRI